MNLHLALDLSPKDAGPGRGQRGLVSALASGKAPREYDEENGGNPLETLAVGTFSGYVGIYVADAQWLSHAADRRQETWVSLPRHGAEVVVPGYRVCLCGWHIPEGNGIVQLKWHPFQRNLLVVATRRSSDLYVYDTNYLVGMSDPFCFRRLPSNDPSLIARLRRPTQSSHQRVWFDLDENGKYLVSGDEEGWIRIWTWDSILQSSGNEPIPHVTKWHAHSGESVFLIQMW